LKRAKLIHSNKVEIKEFKNTFIQGVMVQSIGKVMLVDYDVYNNIVRYSVIKNDMNYITEDITDAINRYNEITTQKTDLIR